MKAETKNMRPAITSDVVILKQRGFFPLYIRNERGYWEMLEYVDNYGGERWKKIDMPLETIQNNIRKYASKKDIARLGL